MTEPIRELTGASVERSLTEDSMHQNESIKLQSTESVSLCGDAVHGELQAVSEKTNGVDDVGEKGVNPNEQGDHGDDTHPSQTGDHGDDTHPSQTGDYGDDTHPSQTGDHGDDTHPSQTGDHGDDTHSSQAVDGEPEMPSDGNMEQTDGSYTQENDNTELVGVGNERLDGEGKNDDDWSLDLTEHDKDMPIQQQGEESIVANEHVGNAGRGSENQPLLGGSEEDEDTSNVMETDQETNSPLVDSSVVTVTEQQDAIETNGGLTEEDQDQSFTAGQIQITEVRGTADLTEEVSEGQLDEQSGDQSGDVSQIQISDVRESTSVDDLQTAVEGEEASDVSQIQITNVSSVQEEAGRMEEDMEVADTIHDANKDAQTVSEDFNMEITGYSIPESEMPNEVASIEGDNESQNAEAAIEGQKIGLTVIEGESSEDNQGKENRDDGAETPSSSLMTGELGDVEMEGGVTDASFQVMENEDSNNGAEGSDKGEEPKIAGQGELLHSASEDNYEATTTPTTSADKTNEAQLLEDGSLQSVPVDEDGVSVAKTMEDNKDVEMTESNVESSLIGAGGSAKVAPRENAGQGGEQGKGDKNNQEIAAESKEKTKEKTEPSDDVVEIDDEDVTITDVQTATTTFKKEGGVGGELSLQIASVSGGTDVSDVLKQEQSKQNVAKASFETTSTPKTEVKKETEIKREIKAEPAKPSKPATRQQQSKIHTCLVCNKVTKCKYNIVRNGDIRHLCDDTCFQKFRASPTQYLRGPPPAATPPKPAPKPLNAPPAQDQHYKTCSVCQLMNIKTKKPFLNWQGMDFCGEDCLGKFQGNLNAACSNCGSTVPTSSKAKFCLRLSNQVKQFCTNVCYMEFKKRQKVCECCQKDISKSPEAFVAPVGKEGLFKDFCSQTCLQRYEDKTNTDVEIVGVERALKTKKPPDGLFNCAVCNKSKTCKHEIRLEGKCHRLCSDPCFSAFQYANKLTMNTCDNCGVYCYNEGMSPQYIQFEGQQKRFCSFICVNKFKGDNKKMVSCAWCNCKKSNFDMIERVDANNKYQLFCSLNCLSLYRVNLQATSNQAVTCDQCKKFVPAQYHLTMSDASVRNFCSYACVMTFQSQFTGKQAAPPPSSQNKVGAPQVSRTLTMTTRQATRGPQAKQTSPSVPAKQNVPIISNVVSLAPQGKKQINVTTNQNVPVVVGNQQQTQGQTTKPKQVTQQIIIQPPLPKSVKNKSLLCKPFVQTKATSCRPHTQTKETQTEEDFEPKKILIPVPVPVYVPCPMPMYTQPTPVPLPIPVPIPIPCFIPTTKKSGDKILKHIKEIREKIPSDPLEAELLMMAEAVAGGEEESDSDTDVEMEPPTEQPKSQDRAATPTPVTQTAAETNTEEGGELGEDMLQMALRMATEMSEPVLDLESSIEPVPVNTEPPPKPKKDVEEEEEEEVYVVRETRSRRGSTKRSRGGGGVKKSKRQKPAPQPQLDTSLNDSIASEPAEEQEPPPDANMYLKYTYGVNAWKHWVLHKNAQLEKVSKQGSGKLKLFKTDMMGCSADELNYSLCLFVKEVRKPNGEEYAPDSIFYLCLGIQQYLFENGRIDNIFTDMYYEKFTECLNEVLLRYEPKVNAAGQLVCRIEEEHLWESKQLGAHSPHVLLNTLVYFNTKYFMLKTAEDHMKLSFTHIMKHWKKVPMVKGNTTGRSVYLRYYCPTPQKVNDNSQKKKKEEMPIYEQAENLDNPLRCPVKLYEFYLSKCPESIKNRNDAFYLVPERSCVPDSPVWYSTMNLSAEALNKMLNRLRLVREIQEALLHTQPVYI